MSSPVEPLLQGTPRLGNKSFQPRNNLLLPPLLPKTVAEYSSYLSMYEQYLFARVRFQALERVLGRRDPNHQVAPTGPLGSMQLPMTEKTVTLPGEETPGIPTVVALADTTPAEREIVRLTAPYVFDDDEFDLNGVNVVLADYSSHKVSVTRTTTLPERTLKVYEPVELGPLPPTRKSDEAKAATHKARKARQRRSRAARKPVAKAEKLAAQAECLSAKTELAKAESEWTKVSYRRQRALARTAKKQAKTPPAKGTLLVPNRKARRAAQFGTPRAATPAGRAGPSKPKN